MKYLNESLSQRLLIAIPPAKKPEKEGDEVPKREVNYGLKKVLEKILQYLQTHAMARG